MLRSNPRQQATGAALRRLCCLVKSLYNVLIIVERCRSGINTDDVSCSCSVATQYSVRKGCKHAALTSELNQWWSLRGFVSHPSCSDLLLCGRLEKQFTSAELEGMFKTLARFGPPSRSFSTRPLLCFRGHLTTCGWISVTFSH